LIEVLVFHRADDDLGPILESDYFAHMGCSSL
jgi:hypothetical protein